jgi:hypothetical protein
MRSSERRKVSNREWVEEVLNYLQKSFAHLCELTGQPHSISTLRINPSLAIEEAKFFLLGVEGELFRLDEEGCVQSKLLPVSHDVRSLQVFCLRPPPAHLVRESICQLATFSSLILQRGWLPDQIKMGPDHAASYGVDMIIESISGKILVAVEIKRSVHELQKFAGDFRQCCKRGQHAKADCAFQQNHGMFEFCRRYQPAYLWIVAPDANVCFQLGYANAMIEGNELHTLPPRSHIELGLEQSEA